MEQIPEGLDAFRDSYARYKIYPLNLISPLSEAAERTYQRELDEAAASLFVQDSVEAHVTIRDLLGINLPGQLQYRHNLQHGGAKFCCVNCSTTESNLFR